LILKKLIEEKRGERLDARISPKKEEEKEII